MRIFGVDPGTATTGYGVVDVGAATKLTYVASGIIQTSKDLSAAVRLQIVREDMLSLFIEYEPDVVVVEQLFFFRNATTVIPVAQARGVILEAAAVRKLNVAEYTPMQVKMHLTGYGRADKKMVQQCVASVLGLSSIIRPDDAADAIAIAITHSRLMLPPPPTNTVVTQ